MSDLRRVTGTERPNIVCRNCAHIKTWHRNEGACRDPLVPASESECDCVAWDYGTNVAAIDSEDTDE